MQLFDFLTEEGLPAKLLKLVPFLLPTKLLVLQDVVEATSRLAAAAVKGAVGCTSSSSQGSEGSVGKESKQTVLEQAVDVLSTERCF